MSCFLRAFGLVFILLAALGAGRSALSAPPTRVLEILSKLFDAPHSKYLLESPQIREFAARLGIANGNRSAITRMKPATLEKELRNALMSSGVEKRVSFSRLENWAGRMDHMAEFQSTRSSFLKALPNRMEIDRIFFSDFVTEPSARVSEAFLRTLGFDGKGNTLRYPRGVNPIERPGDHLQFLYESEYTLAESTKLLDWYGPENGISPADWLNKSSNARKNWVQQHFQSGSGSSQDGSLILLSDDPKMPFLPKRLTMSSTGNWVLILKPMDTLEEWSTQAMLISRRFGTGSARGMVSMPRGAFYGADAAARKIAVQENLGFFTFMNDLDVLERLETGAERHARDSRAAAEEYIGDPGLGPMTRIKQRKLEEFLRSKFSQRILDFEELAREVQDTADSFVYVGGTAYRPDLVGPLRIGFEVRDANRDFNLLRERVVRAAYYAQSGRTQFSLFSSLKAFDSVKDFDRLSKVVRDSLKEVFPVKKKSGMNYGISDLRSIETYRNLAYPMRDWSDHLKAMGLERLKGQVEDAQAAYQMKLESISEAFSAGRISAEKASLKYQAALADFSRESGLARGFQEWHAAHLSADPAWSRYMNIHLRELAPLADVYPRNAWEGAIDLRVERWVNRWIERAAVVDDVRFSLNRDGLNVSAKRPVLVISTDGLTEVERAELLQSYSEALSSGLVGFPHKEGAGHLYSRFGSYLFDHNAGIQVNKVYLSDSDKIEPLLALSPMEELRLRHYVDRSTKDYWRTVGNFDYAGLKGGQARGWLFENSARPDINGNHNCSSWMCMAPVGDARQSLYELVGATSRNDVHRNPGWWLRFLVAGASSERVPYVVYWTQEPLAHVLTRVRSGKEFIRWNFKLK